MAREGPRENVPSVYGLDVTDVSRWEQTVLNPALQILERLSKGEEPSVAPIRVQGEGQRNKRSRHTCDLCDKLVIGDLEWTAHLKSKKHLYHVKKKKRSEPTGEQSQVSSAPPVSAGPSASDGCSHTSQEPSQDSRTTHKGVAVSV